jgi:hypothetical protein
MPPAGSTPRYAEKNASGVVTSTRCVTSASSERAYRTGNPPNSAGSASSRRRTGATPSGDARKICTRGPKL